MPFFDGNDEFESISFERFDYVLVGAGAAGILLAIKLSEIGKNVLLIESGHFKEDPERQNLNSVEQKGKFLENAVIGRKRAIGGTTITWGGQSLPFSSIDFEKRPWVENSGWPISFQSLEPFYNLANQFMGIDTLNYDTDIFKKTGVEYLQFNNNLLKYHFSKWAPEPNFRKKYEKVLEKKVTILYNTVLTRIETDKSEKINFIEVINFDKIKRKIPIKNLILTAGTIETIRVLLINSHISKSKWLGLGFMDHPCIEVGKIIPTKNFSIQQQFNTHISEKRKYSIRLSLSENIQKEKKITNASASIMFTYPEDRFDPYSEIRAFLKYKNWKALPHMFKNVPSFFVSLYALLFYKLIYKKGATPKLVLMLEQEPIKSSFISLGNEVDQFNQPKALINWQISFKSWESVNHIVNYCKSELERLNLGKLIKHEIINDHINGPKLLSDVNHHMGGTRMSSKEDEGIVDSDLKVWGYSNFYICSCSVFPTGSHSNPTLTLLALAERLVQYLSKK